MQLLQAHQGHAHLGRGPGVLLSTLVALSLMAATTIAQQMPRLPGVGKQPNFHPLIPGELPPGMTSSVRLLRGGCVCGYFQPVQITSDATLAVSVASEGTFTSPTPSPALLGLLVGPVYRLRVTNIPGYEERAVYPTIEMVDRLYPPAGAEKRFPVPIELTTEDLLLAVQGHFITRVVYLEDPHKALPTQGDAQHPSWFDAGPGAHPLVEAQELGRPMAIVRLGGRVPDIRNGPDTAFLNGCPALKVYFGPQAIEPSEPTIAPTSNEVAVPSAPESVTPEISGRISVTARPIPTHGTPNDGAQR
ncbi:MAG TPA: hypothetical protein VHV77_05140 [Pirellulales bacterium]|nr:hypothetical protein [Pirellulales bacterium]